jgi:S-adenosyl-L-methionine hydrolase (adenosine-forming)
MQLITLTTDYGYQDHYVAILKASMLKSMPNAHVMDITHGISPFNISHAELVLRQAWEHFPAGTIHVVCVRTYYAEQPEWLWLAYEGHYFVCPNHGLLPMLFPDGAATAQKLILPEQADTLTMMSRLGEIVAADCDVEGLVTSDLTLLSGLKLRPVVTHDRMRGTIIYVDHYGNVLTNIRKAEFELWLQGRAFKLMLKRNEPLVEIHLHYAQVPSGEPVAIWSQSGHLMVALRNSNAHTMLYLETNDVIDVVITTA